MEVIIVLALIFLNGIFAMAEIAVISARKSKLQTLAQKGDKNAGEALKLANSPNTFLSTVQVGITLVGIFAGAFGGATIAEQLATYFDTFPQLAPYSQALGIGLVVAAITYLSLIFGELVPKRIALTNPEKIASIMTGPMNTLSVLAAPLVQLLSLSTTGIMKILNIPDKGEVTVSEDEIKMLVREGARIGVFELGEKDILEGALSFADKNAKALMTPRSEMITIKSSASLTTVKRTIANRPRGYYPIIKTSPDDIIGVLRTEDILDKILKGREVDWREYLHKPLFIPQTNGALKILEAIKKSGVHLAIVVDEYGNVQGVLTLSDVLEAIVGDIPEVNETDDNGVQKRDDGTYLVDGQVHIAEVRKMFQLKKAKGESTGSYQTIGGYLMHTLGRIPRVGDRVQLDHVKAEIVDMDGNRVDKILIAPSKK